MAKPKRRTVRRKKQYQVQTDVLGLWSSSMGKGGKRLFFKTKKAAKRFADRLNVKYRGGFNTRIVDYYV